MATKTLVRKRTAKKSAKEKQPTRMLKCYCAQCGYTTRTTEKWIKLYGAPICPHNAMVMKIRRAPIRKPK